MVYIPCRHFLDFDNKRSFFRSRLKANAPRSGRVPPLEIIVKRESVMYDTFVQLSSRSKREMQGRLQVTFEGEDGVDAGGLTKEMYSILAREIFNPNYGLFIKSHDSPTFQPNPHSSVNNLHLQYFNFVGRIIGKAIYDGNQFDAYVRILFDTLKSYPCVSLNIFF